MAKRKNKLLLSDLFPELAFSELAFEGIPDGIHILDE